MHSRVNDTISLGAECHEGQSTLSILEHSASDETSKLHSKNDIDIGAKHLNREIEPKIKVRQTIKSIFEPGTTAGSSTLYGSFHIIKGQLPRY